MKKIFLLIAVAASLVACSKGDDNQQVSPSSELKVLEPSSVEILKNGTEEIGYQSLLKNGVIVLEPNTAYRVNIAFGQQGVTFSEGDFSKFTEKNGVFSADFYGMNAKDILEKVVFKKENYSDYSLSFQQSAFKPNYLIDAQADADWTGKVKTLTELSSDGKILKVLTLKNPILLQFSPDEVNVTFPDKVFLEKVTIDNKDVIEVKKLGKGETYTLTIADSELFNQAQNGIELPVYKMQENGEKGEKIGEITLVSDRLPYLEKYYFGYNSYSWEHGYDKLNMKESNTHESFQNVAFYIGGSPADVVIEDLNNEYITKAERDSNGSKTWTLTIKEDKRGIKITEPIKVFEVFEAEEAPDGTLTKKANAKGRTIYLKNYSK